MLIYQINEIEEADISLDKVNEYQDELQNLNNFEKDGFVPDVVIVDPPRKGCEESLLKTVACEFAPERIVYVSCDVATLARDTAILEKLGYKLIEYTPCDLFPRTAHVETVALFVKGE